MTTSQRRGAGQPPEQPANTPAAIPDDWFAERVTIGVTTFEIGKLLPMEAFSILEMLRPAVGAALALAPANAGLPQMIATVLRLDPVILAGVRPVLFGQVKFTNRGTQTPTVLAGREDEAFVDLEPVHVYEVLGRCLARNFQGSWDALVSHRLRGLVPENLW